MKQFENKISNYNMLKGVLRRFAIKTEGSIYSFEVLADFFLTKFDLGNFDELDDTNRVDEFILILDRHSQHNRAAQLRLMNVLILTFEQHLKFNLHHIELNLEAYEKIATNEELSSNTDQWVGGWDPRFILQNVDVYVENIEKTLSIWQEESKELSEVIQKLIYGPFADNSKHIWLKRLKKAGA